MVSAGAEIFRIGFFADDFHFLDVARRTPLLAALGGQYGIFPWYRPLSRELFFALVAAFGPWAALVARLVSLAAMGGCALLIDRIGRPWAGARAGRIAAILFATYGTTRFLMAWASGFQDLLALLLTLLALDALQRGRAGLALLWAGLAPFSKETAIIVFPLLALHASLLAPPEERRRLRTYAGLALVALAVVAVHLLVRRTWHGGRSVEGIAFVPKDLASALLVVIGGFAGRRPVFDAIPAVLAIATAIAAAAWMAGARERSDPAAPDSIGRALGFLGGAALLGLLPMVGGNLLRLTLANAYYAFAAAPFLALLLGMVVARLRPAFAGSLLVAALAGWNVLSLGYRAPNMSTLEGWQFVRWDWNEAVRLSEVSQRLGEDLRAQAPARSDSSVILYGALPAGCFFQTEDGPQSRYLLGDPRVRSYFINATPFGVPEGRTALLEFDPVTLHLRAELKAGNDRARYAATSLAAGDAGGAWAFAALGDSEMRSAFDLSYFRAGAALLARGPEAYLRTLARAGLADTTGDDPRRQARRSLVIQQPLEEPLVDALSHPTTASAHLRLARVFATLGGWVSAAVEWRIAQHLAPLDPVERMNLASSLDRMGDPRSARRELEKMRLDVRGSALESVVRDSLAALDARGANQPARAPRAAIGRPLESSLDDNGKEKNAPPEGR